MSEIATAAVQPNARGTFYCPKAVQLLKTSVKSENDQIVEAHMIILAAVRPGFQKLN